MALLIPGIHTFCVAWVIREAANSGDLSSRIESRVAFCEPRLGLGTVISPHLDGFHANAQLGPESETKLAVCGRSARQHVQLSEQIQAACHVMRQAQPYRGLFACSGDDPLNPEHTSARGARPASLQYPIVDARSAPRGQTTPYQRAGLHQR